MPKLSELKKQKPFFIFQGPAGTGKTTFALRFPRPFVLNLDNNINGPIKVYTAEKNTQLLENIEYESFPQEPHLKFPAILQALEKACNSPDYDTLIIDSFTVLSAHLISYILHKFPTKTGNMEIPSWGIYLSAITKLVNQLRDVDKFKIITAHETFSEFEDKTYRHALLAPGQTQNSLPALVSDVFRFEVKREFLGSKMQTVHSIRSFQEDKHPGLKSTCPLPETFPPSQESVNIIVKHFN